MLSINRKHARLAATAAISILLALGLWYLVVGSEQVDTQLDLRLDYRGLPENLVVRDGIVSRVTVRLRGSAELLRGTYARDLSYTVNLSEVGLGANVLPLDLAGLPEFKAFEVIEVSPPRLMLEVDALAERLVPLEASVSPLPENSPLRLSYAMLDQSHVAARGPEAAVNALDSLVVRYDPGPNPVAGSRAINVAIPAPDQVSVTPPVTTLRYTLVLKTREVSLERAVQLDAQVRASYRTVPDRVALSVEMPEGRVGDAVYLANVRVLVPAPEDLAPGKSAEAAVLVMLPEGSRLVRVEPSTVRVERAAGPAPRPSESPSGPPPAQPDQPAQSLERPRPNFARGQMDIGVPPDALPLSPAPGAVPGGSAGHEDDPVNP